MIGWEQGTVKYAYDRPGTGYCKKSGRAIKVKTEPA